MSNANRKVGLYSFEFINEAEMKLEGNKLIKYFDYLIDFIKNKEYSDKTRDLISTNKFYFFADYTSNGTKKNIFFKSAKTSHRPPLIKKNTGNERENPKLIDEGESEKTHLATKYKNDELIIAIEERRNGVSISQVVNYLNDFINQLPIETQYFKGLHIETRYSINLNIIPYEGFLEHLDEFDRITIGTIEIDKQHLGSEYLNLANLGDTIRKIITVTFKANPRDSILEETIRDLYNKFTSTDHKIKRIRIQGITAENTKIQLDTNNLKKIERFDVELDETTGIVRSNQMFEKLNIILSDL